MTVRSSVIVIAEPVVTITESEMTIIGLLMVIGSYAMKCRDPVTTIRCSVIVIAGPLMMIAETPIVMTEPRRLIGEAPMVIAERRRVRFAPGRLCETLASDCDQPIACQVQLRIGSARRMGMSSGCEFSSRRAS
jgi:hypothetical protein